MCADVKKLKTVAVILAGGTGQRMGVDKPKQLLKVAGLPIIEHTIKLFQSVDEIDEIIVMMTPTYIKEAKQIVKKYPKVSRVTEGGETRNQTSLRALDAINLEECKVLFHDAVRPLISKDIVVECISRLDEYKAVDVAIPSADTIIETKDGMIRDIPDRSRLMRGQTPQGFLLSAIREAYSIALRDNDFKATDDCGVVLKYLPSVPISVVYGSEQNVKVTHPIDVHIVDKLFQLSSLKSATDNDADTESLFLEKTIVIFGGSYGIGASIGKLAKSNGAKIFSYSRSTTNTHIENMRDVEQALKDAYGKAGRIDYVVNTAGILEIQELEKSDVESIRSQIEINYTGPVMIAKAALPYLKKTNGQLLLFTSSSYTRGRANYSLYSSSKAAIVNLTQALAEEWSDCGVRINCVNPERTLTPMRVKAFGKEDAGSLLDPDVVAGISLKVLSRDITGQVFDVRREDNNLFH